MTITRFDIGKPLLEYSFSAWTWGACEREMNFFKDRGLPVDKETSLSSRGESTDYYEIQLDNWCKIFKFLSIEISENRISGNDELNKRCKNVYFAYQHLSEDEKKSCANFQQRLQDFLMQKNASLLHIQSTLLNISNKLQLNLFKSMPSDEKGGLSLEKLIDQNEQLFIANSSLHRQIIDASRKKCEEYNSLASLTSIKLPTSVASEKKYILAEKKFKYLNFPPDSKVIKNVPLESIEKLDRKVDTLLTEIAACRTILGVGSTQCLSEFETLCHKYSSFPSPLIWILNDKDLSESQKYNLIDALADKSPLNSTVKNIEIASGVPAYPKFTSRSPLIHAVENGNVEIVELLLNKGADVHAQYVNEFAQDGDSQFKDQLNALLTAAKAGNPNIVDCLIKHHADFNARNAQERTALHLTKNKRCTELLINAGANVNAVDAERNTPLHLLSREKFEKYMITKEERINRVQENLALMSLLIEKGANVNLQNKSGLTPLCLAVKQHGKNIQQSKQQVQLLCHHEADPNLAAPLLRLYDDNLASVFKGEKKRLIRLEIAKLLLEKGADLTAIDGRGETILHKVVCKQEEEAAQYFLGLPNIEKIINFQQSEMHETPLHAACYWGAGQSEDFFAESTRGLNIIKTLLEHGADPLALYQWNDTCYTPREYAVSKGFTSGKRRKLENCAELKLVKEWETAAVPVLEEQCKKLSSELQQMQTKLNQMESKLNKVKPPTQDKLFSSHLFWQPAQENSHPENTRDWRPFRH